jgi:hypothetical protein
MSHELDGCRDVRRNRSIIGICRDAAAQRAIHRIGAHGTPQA